MKILNSIFTYLIILIIPIFMTTEVKTQDEGIEELSLIHI